MHGIANGFYRQTLIGMTIRTYLTKALFPTSIALIVCYFLLKEISIQQIPNTLGRAPVLALIVGFILYSLLVWSKALRFRELLELDVPVKQLAPILALHTFWGNLLPMRSGDLSYIYLMKRREGVDETKSVASLMLASIIDLMLLLAFMVGTGWLLRSSFSEELSYTILFIAPLMMFCALAILLSTACTAPNACIAIASLCAKPLLYFEKRPVTWLVNKCLRVIHELTNIRFNWRFSKIWGYSLLGLGIRFGFQCYLAREMGIDISVVRLTFALAFTSIFNLLPVQSIGNFGTVEFPFAWVLMRFGTQKELAIVAGFSLHLIILLYCIPLGIYGLIKKRRHHKHEMKMSGKIPN